MKTLKEALSAEHSFSLLRRIGYSEQEATDLHLSGLAAIDRRDLSEESALELLGSNPANLFSPAANWAHWKEMKTDSNIFLVDYYSGAYFRPLAPSKFALFGVEGLPPKLPPEAVLEPSDCRWRFNSIPIAVVNSEAELLCLANSFNRDVGQRHRIFFRGQVKHYPIPRKPLTRLLLYGNVATTEPSMLTTAFRERFPYVSTERHWRAIIADIDYRVTGYHDKRHSVEDRYESVYVGKDAMIAKWTTVSTMAIMQHYGLPTYGLDVTTSIQSAWWFATHKYSNLSGVSSYAPHNWRGSSPPEWPVIYVLRSGSGEYIGNLDLPATRPARQHAVFAPGGWGPHGNICADDLIAIIRLAPDVGAAQGATKDVFPDEGTDPMYAELQKLRTNLLTSNHPLYGAAGFNYVHHFS